jgi:ribosomal protein S18 acetylase RimI-like enzyme
MIRKNITYITGADELLDNIQSLWEGLNKHHELVSPHFNGDFQNYTFTQRKAELLKKNQNGRFRIDIAWADGHAVGYIIAAIHEGGVGEIESIFIQDEYRGQGIGNELMRRVLEWMDNARVHQKIVDVAVGNEGAFDFYAQFGFFPRITILKQKGLNAP